MKLINVLIILMMPQSVMSQEKKNFDTTKCDTTDFGSGFRRIDLSFDQSELIQDVFRGDTLLYSKINENEKLEAAIFEYHTSGRLRKISHFDDECKAGLELQFYENGFLASYGSWICADRDTLIEDNITRTNVQTGEIETTVRFNRSLSLKDGFWLIYDTDGHLLRREFWIDGDRKW